jgi:hypothetical protein
VSSDVVRHVYYVIINTAVSYYFVFRKEMSSKYFVASVQDFAAVQLRPSLVWGVACRRLVAGRSGHVSLISIGQATREEITSF